MRRFRWLSAGDPPWNFDLRRSGWVLLEPAEPGTAAALLDEPDRAAEVTRQAERACTIILGVETSSERARFLAAGFGEALGADIAYQELEQRALRLAGLLDAVPRKRRHGPLELDLVLRDGLIGSRRLGLHPREFGLLWRLAEAPGKPVRPQDLLAEVWRLNFKPETNSLAVHVCRLRAKLASVGLSGIVSTTPEGCYALVAIPAPAFPLATRREPGNQSRRAPATLTGRREEPA